MANVDDAYGFVAVGRLGDSNGNIPLHSIQLGTSANAKKGDILTISTNAGYFKLATSAEPPYYIATEEKLAATAGDRILAVPILPDIIFRAQCSGTYAQATYFGELVDIEGSNGAMEVNEDLSTNDTVRIIGLWDDPNNAVGENAQVLVFFNKTAFGTSNSL